MDSNQTQTQSDYSNFIFALKELGYEESFNNFYKKKEFDKNFPLNLPKWDIIFNTNLFDINFNIKFEGENLKNLCTNEVKGTVIKMLNQDSNKPVFVLRMPKGDLCVAKYLPQANQEERNGYARYLEELRFFKNNLIETRGYLSNKILTPRELPQKFIKMDYYEHDLQGLLLNPSFEFTIDQQKKVLCSVLRALGSLHGSNLIHNNVCTSNILINTGGQIRLTGFSAMCSKASAFTEYLDKVATSTSCRAPEMLMKIKKYTDKVDIWSLGVVFLQMDLGIGVMRGRTREDQLKEVYKYLGSLQEEEFLNNSESPKLDSLPHYHYLKSQKPWQRTIPHILKTKDSNLAHFVDRALNYNPAQRPNPQNSVVIITKSIEKIKELEKVEFPKVKSSHHVDFFPQFSVKFENLSKLPEEIFQDPNENNFIYRWIVNRIDFIRKRVDNFKQLNSKMKIQDSYDIRSLKNKINSWGEKVQQKYQFTKQTLQALESKSNWEAAFTSMLNDLESDPPRTLVSLDLQPFECLLTELKKIHNNADLLLAQSKQFYSTINSFLSSKHLLKQVWPPEDYQNLLHQLNLLNSNFGQQFMSLNSYCKLFKGTMDSVLNERKELSNMIGYASPQLFFSNKAPNLNELEGGNPTNWVSSCLSVYKFCLVEFEKAKQIVDILLKTCNPQPDQLLAQDRIVKKEAIPPPQKLIAQSSPSVPSIPSEAAIAASKTMRSATNLTYTQSIKEDLTHFLQSALDNGALKKNFNQCVKNYEEQYLNGNIKGSYKMPPLKVENLKLNSNFLQQNGGKPMKTEKGKGLGNEGKWELFSKYLEEKVKISERDPKKVISSQLKNDDKVHSRVSRVIDIIQKYPELCTTSPQLNNFKLKHFGHLANQSNNNVTKEELAIETNDNDNSEDYYQTKPIRFTHNYTDWRRRNQPFDTNIKNLQVLTNKPIVEFKEIPLDYKGGMQ